VRLSTLLTDFGVPAPTARRPDAASVQGIRDLMQRSARALYLSNDGEHVRRVLDRVRHVALYCYLTGLRELWATELYAARLSSREGPL
jgi:hypothetical protein